MYYFERQAVFAVLGTTVMFIVSRFNYQRLRGAGKILLYISLFLMVIVLIPASASSAMAPVAGSVWAC